MKKTSLLALFGFLFFSCSDQNDTGIPIAGPTPEAFQTLFATELHNQTQAFTMNAEDGLVTFTSSKGVEFSIDGSCLRLNGLAVTGPVNIEYVEIFDKGAMMATNKTTMGIFNTDKQLLYSGGEFYINATKNGQNLTLACSMTLNVPTSLTGGTDTAMQPFIGTIDADNNLIWENTTTLAQLSIGTLNATSSVEAYKAIITNFGWFNCDRFANTTDPQTTISALIPQGYNSDNSMVFIAAKNIPNSLGSSYGKYPVGLECHLIFVSESNGSYRYAIKQDQVLTENFEVIFHSNEMQTATAAQLTATINALP